MVVDTLMSSLQQKCLVQHPTFTAVTSLLVNHYFFFRMYFDLIIDYIEYPINKIEEAKKLQQYLWARRIPPEHSAVFHAAKKIEHRVIAARLQNAEDGLLSAEELEKVCVVICYFVWMA